MCALGDLAQPVKLIPNLTLLFALLAAVLRAVVGNVASAGGRAALLDDPPPAPAHLPERA